MAKDIEQELNELLKIKEEVDKIRGFKEAIEKCEIVSQLMYDFLNSKNLIKPDVVYYIATNEVGQYIEGFRG